MTSPKPLQGMIDELLKADAESTAGPWERKPADSYYGMDVVVINREKSHDLDEQITMPCGDYKTAHFISLAKNSAPEIVRRQAEIIRVMREGLQNIVAAVEDVGTLEEINVISAAKHALAQVKKLESGC
jgi:hypothetical protein